MRPVSSCVEYLYRVISNLTYFRKNHADISYLNTDPVDVSLTFLSGKFNTVFDDKDKLGELFADIFSAAAINRTRYSEYNPFKMVLSDKALDVLEIYFKMLASQMNDEIYNFGDGKYMLH